MRTSFRKPPPRSKPSWGAKMGKPKAKVWTICYQRDDDCEVIAVKSTKKKAVDRACALVGELGELISIRYTARVRGDDDGNSDEIWIDAVDPSSGRTAHPAIYTVNGLDVDGDEF